MLEVEVDGETDVIFNTNVEVTAGNMNVAIIEDTNDIEVTVNRQEYVITGDEIYIPKRYEDAPTWMQNLINQVVDVSISAQIQDLNEISMSLESMIDAMEVAKNTYEMSVISSNDIDERINTAITTLNSAMNTADATVLEVAQTRVTPEEAAVITVDVITAELAKTEAGTLGATVSNLQTAIANEEEARSTSIEVLTSSIEGAFDANATAFNTINTYIGIDEAGASTGTGLSAYIEGDDGTFGSTGSELNNQVVATAEKVESKFAYNSTVKINGVSYTSGFGLATSQIAGSVVPAGDSEFWVTADKFKLRAASQTAASQQPFTVDAVTGDIKFIGTVDFASVKGIDAGVTGILDTNNDDFAIRLGYDDYAELVSSSTAGSTIIKGGHVNTELIEAGAINAGHIDAYAISGKTITGGTINGTEINGTVINGARINGAVIRASYLDLDGQLEVLTNYHLCTSHAQLKALIASGKLGRLVTDADKLQNGGDAIYLASDDEWRIPSLSTISASTGYVPLPAGSIINSYIYAFNNATAGTNKKAVSIRPMVGFGSGEFIKSNGNINPALQSYPTGTPISIAYYISNIQIFKIDIYVELLSSMQGGVSNNRTRANVYSYGNGTSSGSVTTYSGYSSESFDTDSTTIIVNNVPLFGTVTVTLYSTTRSQFVGLGEEGSWQTSGYGSFKVECSGNQDFIPFDWSSGTIYGAVLSQSAYARINGLFLNNMV